MPQTKTPGKRAATLAFSDVSVVALQRRSQRQDRYVGSAKRGGCSKSSFLKVRLFIGILVQITKLWFHIPFYRLSRQTPHAPDSCRLLAWRMPVCCSSQPELTIRSRLRRNAEGSSLGLDVNSQLSFYAANWRNLRADMPTTMRKCTSKELLERNHS